MSSSESSIRAVFRVCVVNAVRRGETLMADLLKTVGSALAGEESSTRNLQLRTQLADAITALRAHEAALVKAYPMALLEIFAEGPSSGKARPADTGMDFGELSLMDDAEVQTEMEFSRAQQLAAHATDATLAELNALVSAAQGLRSIQPERNPLRPECYIRALQRVVGDTGVSSEVRQVWMQRMREPLSQLLSEEYRAASKALREQGVQPVGYAPRGTGRASLQGGGYAPSQQGGGYATGYGTGYGTGFGGVNDHAAVYSRSGAASNWGGPYQQNAEAEEALLTVGILRQMLAAELGGGAPVAMPSGYYPPGQAPGYVPQAAAEAMEDIAQLERIVGRLAQPSAPALPTLPVAHQGMPPPGWRGTGPGAVAVPVYAVPHGAVQGAVPMDAGAVAGEVVGRMVAHIVQDQRLLPSVQRAVRNLEPALQQLVRHDPHFFDDDTHPARRMLDEVTGRSRAFAAENAPGFSRFMRVVNEAVVHLSGQNIQDAAPFASVLTALEAAWNAQAQKERAQREAKEQALRVAQQRAMLASRIAAGFRQLPDTGEVPPDVFDFACGPWAEVVALAQVSAADPAADEGDPGGYLALVPELFWSVQPAQVGADAQRLSAVLPRLQATLRHGLQSIGRSAPQVEAFLDRLQARHDEVLALALAAQARAAEAPQAPDSSSQSLAGDSLQDELPSAMGGVDIDLPAEEPTPSGAADLHPEFQVGVWVELISQRKAVRTQLTWASPHKTLFLFTAQDKSTQSMTRRMRDKLMAEGSLRVLPEAAAHQKR